MSNNIIINNVTMPLRPAVSMSAAIYLDIVNQGEETVELISVSTRVARHSMVHLSFEEDGVSKMQHQTSLNIPAKGKRRFKPGSYHIMLMGLDKLEISKPFEVTLGFRRHDDVIFTVVPD